MLEKTYTSHFVQGDLFSPAIDRKSTALDLVQTLQLAEAAQELQIALEIDPYLADLRTLLAAVNLLRNAEASNQSSPEHLAMIWKELRTHQSTFPVTVWRLVEPWLCRRIVELCSQGYSDYVSKESGLHTGYCQLILGHSDIAYQLLLECIGREKKVEAQLWGYFADSCMDLNRTSEANVGYLRAMFAAAWLIDFSTLRHGGIRAVHRQLLDSYPDRVAMALLPVKCWFADIVYVPKRATWIPDLVEDVRNVQCEDDVATYREFAACLLLDQTETSDVKSDTLRKKMKSLHSGLFKEYLESIADE